MRLGWRESGLNDFTFFTRKNYTRYQVGDALIERLKFCMRRVREAGTARLRPEVMRLSRHRAPAI